MASDYGHCGNVSGVNTCCNYLKALVFHIVPKRRHSFGFNDRGQVYYKLPRILMLIKLHFQTNTPNEK